LGSVLAVGHLKHTHHTPAPKHTSTPTHTHTHTIHPHPNTHPLPHTHTHTHHTPAAKHTSIPTHMLIKKNQHAYQHTTHADIRSWLNCSWLNAQIFSPVTKSVAALQALVPVFQEDKGPHIQQLEFISAPYLAV